MESVETEGQSIDDAIARALQRLGVSRDKVDIEILANATRGLFGFGGRRAKVRATLRRRLSFDSAPPSADAPAPPAPTAPRETKGAAGAPPQRARPTIAPRREPPREGRREVAAPRRARPAARSAPRPEPRPAPRAELPLDPAALERGRGALAEIVRLSGVEAQVAVADDADGARLVIDGDPHGILIGRRGQTLDALEYLINRIVSQDEDSPSRLVVDAQGYRARRRQSLEEMARRLAERARERGKPVTLSPMSPRDRRVVHLVLQGDPTLKTHSAGTGYYRKLVIVPAGAPRRTARSRGPEAPE